MLNLAFRGLTLPRLGARSPWWVRSLFSGGTEGAWYDPSDKSTLFQDSAGTTPVTASGQPVGLMLDKSGNGNHSTQATSSKRPTYTEGGGLAWLYFDGVDDFMSHPSHPFTFTGAVTCAVGFSKTGAFKSFETFYSAGANSGNNPERTMAFLLGNTAQFGGTLPCIATDIYKPSGVRGSTAITNSSNNVALWKTANWSTHRIGDNITISLNGVDETEVDYGGTNPLALTAGKSHIGVFDPVALAKSFYEGSMYGLVTIKEELSAGNASKLDTYLAGKSGVTL